MLIKSIRTVHNGAYGCEAQNGIEPPSWSSFDIHVIGMITEILIDSLTTISI